MLKLTLPLPVTVNHYWGQRGKFRFITARGLAFRQTVAEAVAEAGVKMEGRLAVFVAIYPPNRVRRDLDNFGKSLCDALQHAGLFDDDEQIDDLHFVRMPVIKGGQCRVVVTQATPVDFSLL